MSTTAFLLLPFPPSVNNLFGNRKGGRFKTRAYKAWIDEAGYALNRQKPLPIFETAVNIHARYGIVDRQMQDLDNLWKAIGDLLESHGILKNDRIIERLTLEWTNEVVGVSVDIEAVG